MSPQASLPEGTSLAAGQSAGTLQGRRESSREAPSRDLEDGEVPAAGAEQGEVGRGTAPGAEEGTGGFIPVWGLHGKALTPEVMGEKLWSCWEEAADALEV